MRRVDGWKLGAIPTQIDREAEHAPPIIQSLAILEFPGDIHAEAPILPPTPHGRARVRSLAAMLVADTHPTRSYWTKNHLTPS
jgi:maleylacetoacetate isomerase